MIYWANLKLPVREESRRMQKFVTPMYHDALKKNLTTDFRTELNTIAKSRFNLILSWFGLQGYGKSFAMMAIFCLFMSLKDPPQKLSERNCHFTLNDLLRAIADARPGETFLLDEQVHTTGLGSKIQQMALRNVEMTVRAKMLSFGFAAPVHIAHNYHYFFEVWDIGSDKPWKANKPMHEQWTVTKNIIHDHKGNMLGYVLTRAPQDKEFLKRYEAKKDKFIDKVTAMKTGQRQELIFEQARELMKKPDFMDRFVQLKTRRLKLLHTKFELSGLMLSVEEMKQLVDQVDYLIMTEGKLKNKRRDKK